MLDSPYLSSEAGRTLSLYAAEPVPLARSAYHQDVGCVLWQTGYNLELISPDATAR